METKSVAQAMARVLRGNACRKIDFYVGSFHVDAAGFELVAKALDAGKIKIVFFEELGDEGGAYGPKVNTMAVGSPAVCTTALGRSIVVHECVHVLYDIRNTNAYGVTDEATSYIAGALYDTYALREFIVSGVSAAIAATGGSRGGISGTTTRAIGISKVYAAKSKGASASAIGISNVGAPTSDEHIDKDAAAIHLAAAEAAATVFDRPAARVSDELVKKLCKTIVAHPLYAHLAKGKKKAH